MRIYTLSGTDIFSHLATEAYFLHHCKEDVVLLWQSHNTVVCGKHQNTAAEVNFEYCQQNNIHIARRLTGGGTVFHDEGNVCFTFIQNHSGKVENTIDYTRFLDPVKAFFNDLAIPVHYSPRHDLMIDNKKISGNAQHVFLKEKRVLHHGTLLFNSDLNEPYNVGSSEHVSINQMINMIEEIADYKVDKKYLLDKPKGVRGRSSDNEKIIKDLNWSPSVDLKNGLEKTYNWISGQLNNGENTLKFKKS